MNSDPLKMSFNSISALVLASLPRNTQVYLWSEARIRLELEPKSNFLRTANISNSKSVFGILGFVFGVLCLV
jgi:hypothetical protein